MADTADAVFILNIPCGLPRDRRDNTRCIETCRKLLAAMVQEAEDHLANIYQASLSSHEGYL